MDSKWIASALGIALFCLSTDGLAQDVPTNLQLLTEVVSGLVDRSLEHIGLDRGDTVVIRLDNKAHAVPVLPGDRFNLEHGDTTVVIIDQQTQALPVFMGNRWVAAFDERELEVYVAEDSMASGTLVHLLFPEGGVSYPRAVRGGLFGEKWFERRAFAEVSLRAVDIETHRLIWAGSLSNHIEDSVPWQMLDAVERDYIIGRPKRPRMKGIHRWVEPVIALGMFMGAASLFYFIRSE